MIIGDSLTGKTGIRRILERTKTLLHEQLGSKYWKVESKHLNPKAISMGELYGSLNIDTKEWSDGLASKIMREMVEKENDEREDWIVFDGPVDSLWVENLNTVLDDNMTLCLSNGERIKLKESMKVLFEVSELTGASPATVSRCGMIYLSEGILRWQSIKHTWLIKMGNKDPNLYCDKLTMHLADKFDQFMGNGLELRAKLKEPIPVGPNNIMISFCNLFEVELSCFFFEFW